MSNSSIVVHPVKGVQECTRQFLTHKTKMQKQANKLGKKWKGRRQSRFKGMRMTLQEDEWRAIWDFDKSYIVQDYGKGEYHQYSFRLQSSSIFPVVDGRIELSHSVKASSFWAARVGVGVGVGVSVKPGLFFTWAKQKYRSKLPLLGFRGIACGIWALKLGSIGTSLSTIG